MNDFHSVAVCELGLVVVGTRYDLLVSFDGDERVSKAERNQELLDRRARIDLSFLTVDHESHGRRG